MEFLSDSSELAAQDVLIFIREAVQRFDSLRGMTFCPYLRTEPPFLPYCYTLPLDEPAGMADGCRGVSGWQLALQDSEIAPIGLRLDGRVPTKVKIKEKNSSAVV